MFRRKEYLSRLLSLLLGIVSQSKYKMVLSMKYATANIRDDYRNNVCEAGQVDYCDVMTQGQTWTWSYCTTPATTPASGPASAPVTAPARQSSAPARQSSAPARQSSAPVPQSSAPVS